MKRLALLLLALFAPLLWEVVPRLPEAHQADLIPVTVLRVVDGDTVDLRIEGRVERVRLIGVSAPEPGQPYYEKATRLLMALTLGREVYASFDPISGPRDTYDRLLLYLWTQLDDDPPLECINAALVASPYARTLTRYPFALMEAFLNLDR